MMIRVTGQSLNSSMLRNINLNNQRFDKLSRQIQQQKRIINPSDDPISSTQLAQLQRSQAAISQYKNNIHRLAGNLAMQESHIDATTQGLQSMLDNLREANNSTHGADEMKVYGAELSMLLDGLIAELNTKDEEGRYLFSGTKTSQQPVIWDEKTHRWSFEGNRESAATLVGNDIEVQVTTHLAEAFGSDLSMLNELHTLAEKMQDPSVDPSTYRADINSALGRVQQSHHHVAALYTELGGRQNHLSLMEETHTQVFTVNSMVQDNLQKLDMAEASMKLEGYRLSAQASNQVYTRIQSLSLFDLI
ncbi:flagellar hook-associated protein FlgL [Enterobacteriaceae bacterium LUAb1]